MLKFATFTVAELIAWRISLLFKYNFMPVQLKKVTLVPIIKNETLDALVANNYRLIAIPTSMSKLLEIIYSASFGSVY